ncbi:MAG: hypothetical protein ACFCVA_19370 [Gammaproteobacteria bacterium]
MPRLKSLSLALGAAGIVTTTLVGTELFSAPATDGGVFFDEVLRANRAACGANDTSSQDRVRYYQKVAATRTEVGPFPTAAAPTADSWLDIEPPLWDNLGSVSLPITTAHPRAQDYFDQGLRLTYAFNHAEARRAFRMAQRLDPDCAMCYWGEALVLGPNINAPMESIALPLALAALRQAEAKAVKTSVKEQSLISALGQRYSDDPKLERATLDAAYADAMGEVAERFPDDSQIAVLYAEALMDLQPWDYWTAGGTEPKGHTEQILAVLDKVLATDPDHPGAIHYYIHMVEASTEPERAEAYARRLPAAMPGAGHLVHMPFHIFYRIGQYQDALSANQAAVAVDEVYIAQASPEGIYPQAYYPHNVHSLMVSAQMAGEATSAVGAAHKLGDLVSDEVARNIPWVQPIKAAPYFAHAQFSASDIVLARPDPGDALPYVKAMWHYARGTALAAKGDAGAAKAEAKAIQELGESADFSALTEGGVPAPELLALARHVVLARGFQAQGELQSARSELEAAVAIEDQLAYMEPPFWYYPVRQTLGAVLLQMGLAREAEMVFVESLARVPNNGWALYGLVETYRQLGDPRAAAVAHQRFQQAWAGEQKSLDLARL